MNEKKLRDELIERLKTIKIGSLKIGKEVPIPYKHIYLPGKKPKMEIWCFKQDIVFYDLLFEKSIGYKDAKIVSNNNEVLNIILEKDSSQNTHDIGLPYVIIETKKGQPNTHEILTYSAKVQMIKTIFPYCRFIFLIFGDISPRTYRHGWNFDEIIPIKDIKNKAEIDNLAKKIEDFIKEVKKDIKKITS